MKKLKNNSILLAFSVILISMTACQKYEDGPAISLRSKSERVANDWKINQATDSGKDVSSDYKRYELNLTKDGGATLSADYNFGGFTYQYVTNGNWSFSNDKEKINFDFENNDADGIYRILKLKEDEMWLFDESDELELHFVPQ